jgi:hypothetical protein
MLLITKDLVVIEVVHDGTIPFKATGPDEIPAYILKNMADHLAPYLTKLYQISLDRGLVPDDWSR